MRKQLTAITLAALMLITPALAAEDLILVPEAYEDLPAVGENNEIQPFDDIEPNYQTVNGTVTEVREYYDLNGDVSNERYFVMIEEVNGGTVTFVITPEAVSITGEDPQEGDYFTGVYDASLPVIMIYPPQYTAVAYAVNLEIEELFVPQDGIIPVNVNGKAVKTPAPFFDNGTLMVPVRAIAEALDYEVIWEAETRTVRLGNAITLSIDKDEYLLGRMAPISLGTAPMLVNTRTYVPLSFFREVVKMNNAYYLEGVVEINNDEKME